MDTQLLLHLNTHISTFSKLYNDENVKIKGNDLVVTFDRILENFYNETLFDAFESLAASQSDQSERSEETNCEEEQVVAKVIRSVPGGSTTTTNHIFQLKYATFNLLKSISLLIYVD